MGRKKTFKKIPALNVTFYFKMGVYFLKEKKMFVA